MTPSYTLHRYLESQDAPKEIHAALNQLERALHSASICLEKVNLNQQQREETEHNLCDLNNEAFSVRSLIRSALIE